MLQALVLGVQWSVVVLVDVWLSLVQPWKL